MENKPNMAILKSPYAEVCKLKRGDFAVPAFNVAHSLMLSDSTRLTTSVQAMLTNLKNREFSETVKVFDGVDGKTLPQKMQSFEKIIGNWIKEYCESPSDKMAESIFHLIQLWGGRAGRNVYVQNGGFKNNFHSGAYKKLIEVALKPFDDMACNVRHAELATKNIKNFGISFATKHLRFWNLFGAENGRFPIYDKRMANGCFGRQDADWRYYCTYISCLESVAREQSVTINDIERYCFSFFDSDDGAKWLKDRGFKQDKS